MTSAQQADMIERLGGMVSYVTKENNRAKKVARLLKFTLLRRGELKRKKVTSLYETMVLQLRKEPSAVREAFWENIDNRARGVNSYGEVASGASSMKYLDKWAPANGIDNPAAIEDYSNWADDEIEFSQILRSIFNAVATTKKLDLIVKKFIETSKSMIETQEKKEQEEIDLQEGDEEDCSDIEKKLKYGRKLTKQRGALERLLSMLYTEICADQLVQTNVAVELRKIASAEKQAKGTAAAAAAVESTEKHESLESDGSAETAGKRKNPENDGGAEASASHAQPEVQAQEAADEAIQKRAKTESSDGGVVVVKDECEKADN